MLTLGPATVRIAVRVQPRSTRDRVVAVHGGALKIQVSAPPVEGAANQAVIDVLAEWLGVPRRTVRIAHGSAGRSKTVEIESGDPPELARRIEAAVAGLR